MAGFPEEEVNRRSLSFRREGQREEEARGRAGAVPGAQSVARDTSIRVGLVENEEAEGA